MKERARFALRAVEALDPLDRLEIAARIVEGAPASMFLRHRVFSDLRAEDRVEILKSVLPGVPDVDRVEILRELVRPMVDRLLEPEVRDGLVSLLHDLDDALQD